MKVNYEDDFLDEKKEVKKKPKVKEKPKSTKKKSVGRMDLIEFLNEVTRGDKNEDQDLLMEMASWYTNRGHEVFSWTPEELWEDTSSINDWTLNDWYWFIQNTHVKRFVGQRQAARMAILASKHLDKIATKGDLTTSDSQLFKLLKDLVENAEKQKPQFFSYSSFSIPPYLENLSDEKSKEDATKAVHALLHLIRKV